MPYPYHYFCDGLWHAAGDAPEKVDTVVRLDGKLEYLKRAMWRGLAEAPDDASKLPKEGA